MTHILFIIAGLIAAIHVYTYGRWLSRQGNAAGSLLAFALAAAAVALPFYHLYKVLSY